MWETTDPDGRRVVMARRAWLHIVDEHPELGELRQVILDTVARPDRRHPGREAAEEWFYRGDAGPSRWLKVVVHYEHGRGSIPTAFPRRGFP